MYGVIRLEIQEYLATIMQMEHLTVYNYIVQIL